MSRSFSSTARALLRFIWKGIEPIPAYEETLGTGIVKNSKLTGADTVEIAGDPHTSTADPNMHVSGQIFKGGIRLTSVHVYDDGRIVYSKKSINESQEQ